VLTLALLLPPGHAHLIARPHPRRVRSWGTQAREHTLAEAGRRASELAAAEKAAAGKAGGAHKGDDVADEDFLDPSVVASAQGRKKPKVRRPAGRALAGPLAREPFAAISL